jgi:hypothetical protein
MIASIHQQGAEPMFPFAVDPGWYDKYWLTEQPRRKRQPRRANMARLVLVVVLLAGGGVVLNHVDTPSNAGGYQDWEQE